MAFTVPDLDRALEEVRRLGAEPIGEVVTAFGSRFVYCREPSGTVIELDEPIPDRASSE